MNSTERIRLAVIIFVVAMGIFAAIQMIGQHMWAELMTMVLGVAGFVLTWEVTEQENE